MGKPVFETCAGLIFLADEAFGVRAVAIPDSAVELALTAENVESMLDQVRPLMDLLHEVVAVVAIQDEETGHALNEENIEQENGKRCTFNANRQGPFGFKCGNGDLTWSD